MLARRAGTTFRARWRSSSLVATDRTMPSVLPVSFFASLTTRISRRSSGQWLSVATCTAILSLPLTCVPISQRTNPPYSDLHALPLPWRAMLDSSPTNRSFTASTSARVCTRHA
jgi:hypothetical protein